MECNGQTTQAQCSKRYVAGEKQPRGDLKTTHWGSSQVAKVDQIVSSRRSLRAASTSRNPSSVTAAARCLRTVPLAAAVCFAPLKCRDNQCVLHYGSNTHIYAVQHAVRSTQYAGEQHAVRGEQHAVRSTR